MKTEFHDKTGKPLYTGDVIQWRLGKFGKSGGGPVLLRVTKTKRGISVAATQTPHVNGQLLRKSYEQYITIVDTSEREVD